MIDLIQLTFRMVFRGFVVSSIILIMNPTSYWGIPLGLIIGMCSEAKSLVGNNNKVVPIEKTPGDRLMALRVLTKHFMHTSKLDHLSDEQVRIVLDAMEDHIKQKQGIDLVSLDKKIDALLESETKESLLKFINKENT